MSLDGRLQALRRRHAEIEMELQKKVQQAAATEQETMALKRMKLTIKDKIQRLESREAEA